MIYPATQPPGPAGGAAGGAASLSSDHGFVSFVLAGERLGIPVERVQEVLNPQAISPVPLAPDAVAGFLNLRGQIVTALDLRARLGLPARDGAQRSMNVVVRDRDELFSLLVDEVGDVVEPAGRAVEPTPPTLAPEWRACALGVLRLEEHLLVVLDVDALLRGEAAGA